MSDSKCLYNRRDQINLIWSQKKNPKNSASRLHSFILIVYPAVRVAGGQEPVPAAIGRETGFTLDRSQDHIGPDMQPFTPSLSCMFLDCGGETREPRANPCRHMSKETPHKKPPCWNWTGNLLAVKEEPLCHCAAPPGCISFIIFWFFYIGIHLFSCN